MEFDAKVGYDEILTELKYEMRSELHVNNVKLIKEKYYYYGLNEKPTLFGKSLCQPTNIFSENFKVLSVLEKFVQPLTELLPNCSFATLMCFAIL